MLLECFSELNGDFYIMAPGDSDRSYLHIVRVLLDAATGTPIDVLLRGEGITNLLKLRQYIRKPGLPVHGFTWTDPLRGNEIHLDSEQCEDILAIESYINWLYNKIDLDIADKTREDFEGFMMWIYDDEKPIHLRHDFEVLLRATLETARDSPSHIPSTRRLRPAKCDATAPRTHRQASDFMHI